MKDFEIGNKITTDEHAKEFILNPTLIKFIFFKPFEILLAAYNIENFRDLWSFNSLKKCKQKFQINSNYYFPQVFEYYEYLDPSSTSYYNLQHIFAYFFSFDEYKNSEKELNKQDQQAKTISSRQQLLEMFKEFFNSILNQTYDSLKSTNTGSLANKSKDNKVLFFEFMLIAQDKLVFIQLLFDRYFLINNNKVNQPFIPERYLADIYTSFLLKKFNIENEIKSLILSEKDCINVNNSYNENSNQKVKSWAGQNSGENPLLKDNDLENEVMKAFSKNLNFSNNQHSIYYFLNISKPELLENLSFLKVLIKETLKENKITKENKLFRLLLICSGNIVLVKILYDFIFCAFKNLIVEKIEKNKKRIKVITNNNSCHNCSSSMPPNIEYGGFNQVKILLMFEKFKSLFLNQHNVNYFKLEKLYEDNITKELRKGFIEAVDDRYIFFAEAFNILLEKINFFDYLKYSFAYSREANSNSSNNIENSAVRINSKFSEILTSTFFKQCINNNTTVVEDMNMSSSKVRNNKAENKNVNILYSSILANASRKEESEKDDSNSLITNESVSLTAYDRAAEKLLKLCFVSLDLLYNYLELIEDFSKFEDVYISFIIKRLLKNTENFDYELEKLIINKCIETTKDKFFHYFKLQTAINSIKILKNKSENLDVNLLGLPAHCLSTISLDCNPSLSNYFSKIFEKEKSTANFPENSKLIYQLGNVEFSIRTRRFNNQLKKLIYEIYNIKSNIIQYEVLSYFKQSRKEVKVVELMNLFSLSENFLEYIISIFVELELLKEVKAYNSASALVDEDAEFANKKYIFNPLFLSGLGNIVKMNLNDQTLIDTLNLDKNSAVDFNEKLYNQAKAYFTKNDFENLNYSSITRSLYEEFKLLYYTAGENSGAEKSNQSWDNNSIHNSDILLKFTDTNSIAFFHACKNPKQTDKAKDLNKGTEQAQEKDSLYGFYNKTKNELHFYLNIEINFLNYNIKAKDYSQKSNQNINNIYDCFIIKACKSLKKCSLKNIFDYLISINNKLLGEIAINKIADRLDKLSEKFFVKKIGELYEYSP